MAETIIAPVRDQTAAELGPITADLGMIVTRAARRFGSKTALVAGGRTLTYEALDDLCDRVAGGLHDIGVRPGDRSRCTRPTGGSGWSPTTRPCGPGPWSTPST